MKQMDNLRRNYEEFTKKGGKKKHLDVCKDDGTHSLKTMKDFYANAISSLH